MRRRWFAGGRTRRCQRPDQVGRSIRRPFINSMRSVVGSLGQVDLNPATTPTWTTGWKPPMSWLIGAANGHDRRFHGWPMTAVAAVAATASILSAFQRIQGPDDFPRSTGWASSRTGRKLDTVNRHRPDDESTNQSTAMNRWTEGCRTRFHNECKWISIRLIRELNWLDWNWADDERRANLMRKSSRDRWADQ